MNDIGTAMKKISVGSLIIYFSHLVLYFIINCTKFDIAKSSLFSEDITTAGEIIASEGIKQTETIRRANGDLRYAPASDDRLKEPQTI